MNTRFSFLRLSPQFSVLVVFVVVLDVCACVDESEPHTGTQSSASPSSPSSPSSPLSSSAAVAAVGGGGGDADDDKVIINIVVVCGCA